MTTILVTGGAGFIGGNLVRQWIAETDWTIVNLDKLTYAGNLESLAAVRNHNSHVFVQGDICDQLLVSKLLAEHAPAAIVNLAAESHVDRSIDAPDSFVRTNIGGTASLLAAALDYWKSLGGDGQHFRFIQVSTDEVYGTLGPTGKFTEETRFDPNSPYAASKAAADHLVSAYHRTYGLPTIITHSSNNYGPFQFPEKLIPLMILNAIDRKPLPVYGDGQHVRDWLHVDDHCRALRRVLEQGRPGETYNIGGCSERANLDTVTRIADIVDELMPQTGSPRSQLIQFVPDRPGHDRRYAIATEKINRELGWRPTIDFDTGLAETVAWYIHHRDWVAQIESGEYRRQRLGLART
jgi:dTDP-glucose 4,6-dehydratase